MGNSAFVAYLDRESYPRGATRTGRTGSIPSPRLEVGEGEEQLVVPVKGEGSGCYSRLRRTVLRYGGNNADMSVSHW